MEATAEILRKGACSADFHALPRLSGFVPLRLDSLSAAGVDSSLVRVSQLEALARLRLGRAAARFLEIRGNDALGFPRIGDYSSERLGISGRELQSFAFVASRLPALPRLASAFTSGEVSWSQTRLLCAAAEAGSEASWLTRARGLTVRELVEAIRADRGESTGSEIRGALEEESDSIEGESPERFSIRCPSLVTLAWRRAVELARRMLGSQAPTWQAAEAIAAEASSSGPGVAESPPAGCSTETARPRVAPRERIAIDEVDSDDEPYESLDPIELDGEMRELVEALAGIDRQLGHGLRRLADLRLHRALGFDSFDAYVRERLGISPAKARALVMVERRSREAPELRRAYRSGDLSWVRALTILPLVRGEHEKAWVARANEVTLRQLQREVGWALDTRDAYGWDSPPPDDGAALERADLQTCARSGEEVADRRVTFFGPASAFAFFRAVVAGLTGPNEPSWRGLERMLLQAIAEWEAQPRHRDPIFARDGWRCSVPACSGRRSLEDHHIVFRSRGGGNEQWNRLAVCASHHLHAVHRYLIRASGRAPDTVVWELGLRPGRAPFLVLHGERYLSPIAL